MITATVHDVVVERLSSTLGQERFRRFFGDGGSIRVREDRLEVVAPTGFQAEMLGRRFGGAIRDAAQEAAGSSPVRVEFTVDPTDGPRGASPAALSSAPAAAPARRAVDRRAGRRSSDLTRPHQLRYRLDGFVVGAHNRLAAECAVRLVDEGVSTGVSPLFVHGECGMGKTHLLQGAAARMLEREAGARVLYTTGEAFTNAFVRAVREGRIEAFHAKHRRLDLLCVDDVHFVSGKKATQAELLHTLNELSNTGARIVLASDEHPSAVRAFSKELVSRFTAGLVARLEAPDEASRRRLISAIAARRGLTLAGDALDAAARRLSGSVREMEGALSRIEALHRLDGGPGAIDASTVRRATAAPRRAARPVRLEALVATVCDELGVGRGELMGKSRAKRVVLARSAAAHLARRMTNHSFSEVAGALGRPNHSTVVTACQRVERLLGKGAMAGGGPDLDGVTLAALLERLEAAVRKSAG